jgi:hypothetical protein
MRWVFSRLFRGPPGLSLTDGTVVEEGTCEGEEGRAEERGVAAGGLRLERGERGADFYMTVASILLGHVPAHRATSG